MSQTELRCPQETLYYHGYPASSTAFTCSKTAPEPLGGAALPYFDLDTLLDFACAGSKYIQIYGTAP